MGFWLVFDFKIKLELVFIDMIIVSLIDNFTVEAIKKTDEDL